MARHSRRLRGGGGGGGGGRGGAGPAAPAAHPPTTTHLAQHVNERREQRRRQHRGLGRRESREQAVGELGVGVARGRVCLERAHALLWRESVQTAQQPRGGLVEERGAVQPALLALLALALLGRGVAPRASASARDGGAQRSDALDEVAVRAWRGVCVRGV
jgi:hypothetical protein